MRSAGILICLLCMIATKGFAAPPVETDPPKQVTVSAEQLTALKWPGEADWKRVEFLKQNPHAYESKWMRVPYSDGVAALQKFAASPEGQKSIAAIAAEYKRTAVPEFWSTDSWLAQRDLLLLLIEDQGKHEEVARLVATEILNPGGPMALRKQSLCKHPAIKLGEQQIDGVCMLRHINLPMASVEGSVWINWRKIQAKYGF